MDEDRLGQSAQGFSQIQYVRPLGAYKARFQGIPDDYFPLTGFQVFKYSLFVVGVIGGTLGMMIGFIFWVIRTNLSDYVTIWSAIFLFFVVVMIFLFYYKGKDRIRQQKQMIQKQQRLEDRLTSKKVKKQDQ